jgi:lysophospholipase L1-like esterase
VIQYGTNDARLHGTKKSSPEEYVQNLHAMIQILQSWNVPKERIYVLSPPPLRDRKFEKDGQLLYTRARIEQFAMASIKLAIEEGVVFVDIYGAIMGYAGDGDGIKELMADGS